MNQHWAIESADEFQALFRNKIDQVVSHLAFSQKWTSHQVEFTINIY